MVSIVIPVYNEEVMIDELFKRTVTAIQSFTEDFEILTVNDGSSDDTLNRLIACHKKEPRFKVINLSRNFGHQSAVLAGLSQAKGEYIGVMDGDLQDPPELFEKFVGRLNEGFDVVYAVRKKRKEGPAKKFSYWLFYRIFEKITATNIPVDSGDFCMIRRKVQQEMLRMPEQSLYLRGLRAFVGFRQSPYEYERSERFAGEAKYDFKQLFNLAYAGIYSFSKFPIKFIRSLGTFVIVASLLYAVKVLISYFMSGTAPEGFVTLFLAITFFSGVQLLFLGVIGEYISRTYDETRGRPLFIIDRKWE